MSICIFFFGIILQTAALTSRQNEAKPIGPVHTLILTRHGDSMWNGKYPGCQETFTGWTDVHLSPVGEQEAIRTGQLLTRHTRGVNIDALFTSTLTRAKMTAHHCLWAYYDRLEQQFAQEKHYQYYNQPNGLQDHVNIANNNQYTVPAKFIMDYRLNERHYGSLQGLVKDEAESGLHGHSPEDVLQWRRSWHATPPPLEDDDPRRIEEIRMYGNLCAGEENVPKSESLTMVAKNRIVRPFVEESLTPLLESSAYQSSKDEGGTALIVAHANSLRALIGVLCNVEQYPNGKALMKLESMKIPTASPLIIRYRKTTSRGMYYPVNSEFEDDTKLPVYPLGSIPLTRRQSFQNIEV